MIHAIWYAVWVDNTLPGKMIVAVIALLLLRALLASAYHLNRYGRENRSLNRVMARLKAERDTQPPTAASGTETKGQKAVPDSAPRHKAPSLIDLDVLKEGLNSSSLISERLAAIGKFRSHQVKVNLNTLQQLTLAREEARPGLAASRLSATMATMLGLLGTFIGLATMIQGIQFALPQDLADVTWESWTQSMRNVFGVLAGIKTAFSASLAGMFCAVLSTFLSARLQRVQAIFFEKLERFTTEDLLPATVPAVEDESLLEAVSLKLQSSFSLLQDILEQNQGVLKDLTAAQQVFVTIIADIRKITLGEASRNLDRVIEQLNQTNRSVLSVVEQLPKIGGTIEATNRRLMERVSEGLDSLISRVPQTPLQDARNSSKSWLYITLLAVLGIALVFLWGKYLIGN